MWSEGTIGVKNEDGKYTAVRYWCKHFDEPSEEYGIDGGRICSLVLKQYGEIVYDYGRGWDIPPQTKEAEQALAILMYEHN
ncbi:hypothetical protein [Hungatella sp.]|uniref:DUF7678 domain-containing protein n=1 Tax=Hungatella sp. TaxID=2613924 RepID=UPI002A83F476|nr:hypothetical protein [Hungatella sp.]MCI9598864.1 hypothetical protein [Bacillota bacterium]